MVITTAFVFDFVCYVRDWWGEKNGFDNDPR